MEATAMRLSSGAGWSYLGGQSDAKEPFDVVVRAFDGAVLAAVGDQERGPDSEPVLVPAGEGRRLCGLHFFARPASAVGSAVVTFRGI